MRLAGRILAMSISVMPWIPAEADSSSDDPGALPSSPTAMDDSKPPVAAESGTLSTGGSTDTGQSTPAAEGKAPVNRAMEEIIVTAQKREESIKDVPISISAFSADKLEALGVDNPADLQRITPGLTYNSQVAYSIIYIRGVGTDAFIPSADQSVASYIDGFYTPFGFNLATKFNNIDRVEVLKGPQGTLFGRNSTGGAINVVTKKPGDHLEVAVEGRVGDFSERGVSAYFSAPLTNSVSASVAVIYDHDRSFQELVDVSATQPEEVTKAITAKVRWRPTDSFTADIGYTHLEYNGLGSLAGPGLHEKPLGIVAGATEPPGRFKYNTNEQMYNNASSDMPTAVFEWAGDPFHVKVLGSYQNSQADALWDYDGGPKAFAYFTPSGQFMRVINGEAQLLSTPGGFLTFDDKLVWTLGYNYFYSRGGFDPVFFGVLNPAAPTNANDPLSLVANLLAVPLDAIRKAYPKAPVPDHVELQLSGIVNTHSNAAYFQTTFKPFDWAALTVGGRYQDETRGMEKSTSGVSVRPDPPIPLFHYGQESTETKSFGPKAVLDFHPFADETLLYASWQRGYKSGTYNCVAIYTRPTYIKPEKVDAIELGIKGYALNKSFNYNAALFQSKLYNQQTLVVSLASGGAVQLATAAEATIRGADFDLTWQPLPSALPGLVTSASGAYLHGRYNNFPNAPGFNQTDGVYFGPGEIVPSRPQNFAGNTTSRTPTYSGTLGLNYVLAAWGGDIEAGVNGSYNSGYFFDTQNTAHDPAYVLLSSRLSYLNERTNLRLSLWGNNLTNKLYYSGTLVTDFNAHATYAPPRMYGLALQWTY